ncbi:AtpZ/AtpI family protein [bacterium]|nr:AtpZ/AtpI family protein [bacterium]
MNTKSDKDAIRRSWATAGTYTHLGFTIAASVLLLFFGGYWLDNKIGTTPLLAIAGAFIGAAGGFINLVRSLNQIQKKKQNNSENADENS